MPNNTQKGNMGEVTAINYLKNHNYIILEQNWRFKHLEIDIIALLDTTLVIVEVKWRSSIAFGAPETFVTKQKQKNLIKAADYYIKSKGLNYETRFDVISIVEGFPASKVEHIIDAFYPHL